MKGILFRPEMILAIKNGSKTVTRRIIKPQPGKGLTIGNISEAGRIIEWVLADKWGDQVDEKCPQPRYHAGETVYIKEAYLILDVNLKDISDNAPYIRVKVQYKDGVEQWKYKPKDDKSKFTVPDNWHSPMFMPAWAARYFIQIIAVSAERLQEITINDAKNEGIQDHVKWIGKECYSDAIIQYATLWDSINPKYPWSSNPWVWRYEFKKVTPNQEEKK